eukprot:3579606-Prorocentrum_lima.AAC.1
MAGWLAAGLWVGCGCLLVLGSAWLVNWAAYQIEWENLWQAVGGWQQLWLKVPQACQVSGEGPTEPTSSNSNE